MDLSFSHLQTLLWCFRFYTEEKYSRVYHLWTLQSIYFHQLKRTSTSEKGDKVGTRYNKEYEQYYIFALEQFLINTYGYSEYDAKVKVMQDFDEVKEDFEMKEIKWICELFDWRDYGNWGDTH